MRLWPLSSLYSPKSYVFLSPTLNLILPSTVTKNHSILFLCPLTVLQIFEGSFQISTKTFLPWGESISGFCCFFFLSLLFFFPTMPLTTFPSAHHSGCPSVYSLLCVNSSFKMWHSELNTILVYVIWLVWNTKIIVLFSVLCTWINIGWVHTSYFNTRLHFWFILRLCLKDW